MFCSMLWRGLLLKRDALSNFPLKLETLIKFVLFCVFLPVLLYINELGIEFNHSLKLPSIECSHSVVNEKKCIYAAKCLYIQCVTLVKICMNTVHCRKCARFFKYTFLKLVLLLFAKIFRIVVCKCRCRMYPHRYLLNVFQKCCGSGSARILQNFVKPGPDEHQSQQLIRIRIKCTIVGVDAHNRRLGG